MPHSVSTRRSDRMLPIGGLLFLAIALAALTVGAVATNGAAKPSKRVVATAQNATLGKTVLTTLKGRTLYSLSVEKSGRFICTASCLSVWHPLVVPAGTKPTGPVKLGTIMRPDTKVTQVTYKGKPLYRFGGDTKAGDDKGEGIKDVGTWHAATTATAKPAPEPQPPAEPPPYQPPSGY
jgi:predicted lipoprotein with Yx(FWY)xxD motif